MTTETVRTAPLNEFVAARANLTDAWADVYVPPDYSVQGLGVGPAVARTVTDVVLSFIVVNEGGTAIQADVRIASGADDWPLTTGEAVAANTVHRLDLGKAQIKSGETLQAKLGAGQTGVLHLSVQRRLDPLIETI